MKQRHFITFIFTVFLSFYSFSQQVYWRSSTVVKSDLSLAYENLDKYEVVQIESEKLKQLLEDNEKVTVPVPISQNEFELFQLENSDVFGPELSTKYPEIKSYLGVSTNNPLRTIRLDFNATGFHAMIVENGERTFIDPVKNEDSRVIIYKASDLKISNDKASFRHKEPSGESHGHIDHSAHIHDPRLNLLRRSTNGTLRTYRLAALCTPQFSSAVGGGNPTKAKSLSAITTTINRVNEVYTRDLGVKLVFSSNTDEAIYLPGDANPPRNDEDLLDELYLFVNDKIGRDNYDLSHGFSTDGGGIAWYASICDKDQFSGGVTGSSNPVGDAFDIDFVAHELGHQFSGDHSFNGTRDNCAGNAGSDTKWEPGSGSTIMGYAGICSTDDLQRNSDPYFHGRNLNIMHQYIQNGGASTCGTSENTGNAKPVVTVPQSGRTIPKSTPFSLTGSATDADVDDVLTYCWEQIDGNGTSGDPNLIGVSNPIFRSFSPTTSPTRYFPQLDDLLNGTSRKGNNLANRTRDLNFKLTVRDNQVGQGQVNDKDLLVKVDGNSGPFLVTSQATTGTSVFVNQLVDVTWDVANTNVSPVNCSEVNILLSTDGGLNFNEVLASNVPNNGSHTVTIPNSVTTSARIKVEASNNFFFNINAENFTVNEPANPTFAVSHAIEDNQVCVNETVNVELSTTPFSGFNSLLSLSYSVPVGLELVNAPSTKSVGTVISFGVKSLGTLSTGTYELEVVLSGGGESKTEIIPVSVIGSLQGKTVNVLFPQNNLLDAPKTIEFAWESSALYSSYQLIVSTSPDLSSPEIDASTEENTFTNEIEFFPATQYYFEVKGFNACNDTASSGIASFTIVDVVCQTFVNSQNLPLPDGPSTFTSALNLDLDEPILDLTVSLEGTHEYTDDLKFSLEKTGANAREVVLFEDACNGGTGRDFNLSLNDKFDDSVPCVPNDGGNYKPQENLSSFYGNSALGEWRLVLFDKFPNLDEGELNKWQLEVCYARPANSSTPELVINNIVAENTTSLLTPQNLNANDADGDNGKIKYEIVSTTEKGLLLLNGIELSAGESFTQEEIDQGSVSFVSGNTPDSQDELLIKLIDEDNVVSNPIALNINLISSSNPSVKGNQLFIFPNPTNSSIMLSESISWELCNTLGEVLSNGSSREIDLSSFTSGLYLLKTDKALLKVVKK